MKILFVVPYPEGTAPSQRFRFEQYFPALSEAGIGYDVASFLDLPGWNVLYRPGHVARKAAAVLRGFWRRFLLLFRVADYDYVFIHREASPLGPPLFEWVTSRVLRKKIVYDFDDAIWLPNTSEHNRIVVRLKWNAKVKAICGWSHRVSCGNAYLRDFALPYNSSATVNPTTIDTDRLHDRVKDQRAGGKPVIGWTGTHSTLKYLDPLVPVLRELEALHDFEFRVISDRAPAFALKSLAFQPWRKETEISDLLQLDIGLMPLEDDPWAKGKCAFKALQYMALGIPAVVSPVGMNSEVVHHGEDGFVCGTAEEWYACLEVLLRDGELRARMGRKARENVVRNYSVASNTENFLRLFR
jgi:glycosyltransferase involved in cell wall biosynthesis